jgi:serine/threonine protein kinase
MGEVYLAEDTRLDRKVALKILPAEFAENTDRMSRFVREAKSASALNHPNIITIYEIGEADGTHFIATEFIDGKTLSEHAKANPLNYKLALEVAIQVASALDEAHSAGIVHRDIKPDNVMVRANGLVKILDFGIAKLSAPATTDEEAATAIQSTSPGMVIGTANYMSPEQAKGRDVDARTDIFSFGVVLYELIAGHQPFEGENALEMIGAILKDEPKPLNADVPAEIQKIIGKCLRKDRDERYQTIRDAGNDLKEVRQELEVRNLMERSLVPNEDENKTQILPATTADEINRTTNQTVVTNPKLKYLAIGLLIMLLAGGGFFGYKYLSPTNKQIESIAVMPFVNESGNQDLEYLSDGMTETLIKSLSQLPNLNVKARSSVFRYKGKEIDAKTIGRELNVQAILNGRVIQRGDRLTLNLELIDAQTENLIWTDEYDRKSSDLVSLQNLIARDVSSKLKIQLSGADLEKLAKKYTNDPEAYRLYLQGRFYWNKRIGPEFERAEAYFQQAVERDPNFALGYVGLADFKEDEDRPRKKEYIRRALAIDELLAEAHASLGYQYMMDYNWAESERELKRAIELNPNYPQAHQWNGMRLMMNGKYDEARASLTRALELDPTSPGINLYYAVFLEVTGRINECILQGKKLIEMEPTYSWAYIQLTRAYRLNGDHQASVETHARNFELIGNEGRAKAIREIFAKGGWQGYLRIVANSSPPAIKASFLAELGEYEKAIEAINKHSEQPTTFWFFLHRTDPFLFPIRDDPRFKEAMKRLDPPQ